MERGNNQVDAKEHHEKSIGETGEEPTDDVDLTPEYAMARDGNGNGWKQE